MSVNDTTQTAGAVLNAVNQAHESLSFTRVSESFDYSIKALIQKYVPGKMTMGQANSLGRSITEKVVPAARQVAIAIWHIRENTVTKHQAMAGNIAGVGSFRLRFWLTTLTAEKPLVLTLCLTPNYWNSLNTRHSPPPGSTRQKAV